VKQLLGGAPARLELEARALARLQHPNVVAVHDVGTTDGQLFVAMELVAGEPLSRWADSHGSIDVLRALIAAGRGLAHAHHEGILHRDFKPANVLVDAAGRPRVADFGLALDKELAVHDASPMGTPGFMAPEIFDGKPASVASDIYAYCRTLADLVVARGDAPHWLAPLVDRGLADDPAARWKSLDELLAAIERELGVDPDRDPRTGRTGRRRWFAVVAAILVGLPVLGAVAKGVTIDLEDAFYTSLVPPITIALAAALFWRTMATTAFNRSGVLRLLAVTATITASHGLALALATSVATAFVADLLILGAFLLGNAVSELDRVYFVSAVTSFAGAAAVAAFPAYAPFIFIAVATGQLPFVYFHWVSRGARPAE